MSVVSMLAWWVPLSVAPAMLPRGGGVYLLILFQIFNA